MAPSKSKIRHQPYTPILFVVFTVVLWYFFQLLVRIVITCLPGGDACLLGWAGWPLHWLVWPIPNPPRFLYRSRALDAIVSFVTLALAVWPAILIFFPADDLTPPPDNDGAACGCPSGADCCHTHDGAQFDA